MLPSIRSLLAALILGSTLATVPAVSGATDAPPASSTTTTVPATSSTTSTPPSSTTSTTEPSPSTTSTTSSTVPGAPSSSTTSTIEPDGEPEDETAECAPLLDSDDGLGIGAPLPNRDGSDALATCVPLHDLDGDGVLDEVTVDVDPGLGEQSAPVTPPPINGPISELSGDGGDWLGSPAIFGSSAEARARLAEAEGRLEEAIELVRSLRLRTKGVDVESADLIEAIAANEREQEATRERLRLRAVSSFVDGASPQLDAATSYDDILEAQAQQSVVEIIFDVDHDSIAAVESIGAAMADDQDRQARRVGALTQSEEVALDGVQVARDAVEQAERELEAFEAGSAIYIEGVVFPIQWPYSTPLIDSWGFPRMTGTSDSHAHQGIDLFAPSGTPLLAAESGYVTRIGNGRLGGNKLWLKGSSGTDWYYAHLSGFASNIGEGQFVEAGTILGYVGNTGNAVGTPPHLHMQVHPNGGDPVNPFPLLNLISERERALATD